MHPWIPHPDKHEMAAPVGGTNYFATWEGITGGPWNVLLIALVGALVEINKMQAL